MSAVSSTGNGWNDPKIVLADVSNATTLSTPDYSDNVHLTALGHNKQFAIINPLFNAAAPLAQFVMNPAGDLVLEIVELATVNTPWATMLIPFDGLID